VVKVLEGSPVPVVLDLCGGTGSWSAPYRDAGYDVVVVDPSSDVPGAVREDVRLWRPPAGMVVRGVLAAPPCTHLSGSGARWWEAKGVDALLDALSVVDACLRIVQLTRPAWWCLENPVGRLSRYLGPPRDTFQPWHYGDPTTKRTCLWGCYQLPVRTPVDPVLGGVVWRMGPSPDRAKLRSITPPGFARAFADANP
jgi:hypothetical protein